MEQNKQKDKIINEIRRLIWKELIKENNILTTNADQQTPEGDKKTNNPEEVPRNIKGEHLKDVDADKCLAQIQELLDWYFG